MQGIENVGHTELMHKRKVIGTHLLLDLCENRLKLCRELGRSRKKEALSRECIGWREHPAIFIQAILRSLDLIGTQKTRSLHTQIVDLYHRQPIFINHHSVQVESVCELFHQSGKTIEARRARSFVGNQMFYGDRNMIGREKRKQSLHTIIQEDQVCIVLVGDFWPADHRQGLPLTHMYPLNAFEPG